MMMVGSCAFSGRILKGLLRLAIKVPGGGEPGPKPR